MLSYTKKKTIVAFEVSSCAECPYVQRFTLENGCDTEYYCKAAQAKQYIPLIPNKNPTSAPVVPKWCPIKLEGSEETLASLLLTRK